MACSLGFRVNVLHGRAFTLAASFHGGEVVPPTQALNIRVALPLPHPGWCERSLFVVRSTGLWPGAVAKSCGQELWPRAPAKTCGEEMGPRTLAKSCGQELWPRHRAQSYGQELCPRTVFRDCGQELWQGGDQMWPNALPKSCGGAGPG